MKNIDCIKDELKFTILFKIVFILAFIYVSWVIFCGRLYVDDLGRSLYGYTDWGYDGRPISDLIMTILSLGTPLLDLTPLPQIFSIIFLSASLAFWGVKYFNKNDAILVSLGLFFFISTPFFIENLSYRFDSLPMSLSLSVLIFSFGIKNRATSFFLTSLSAVISLSLYQASISLFITLAIIDLIHGIYFSKNKINCKESFSNTSIYATSLIIGFLFYKLVIVKVFSGGGYSNLHSKTIPINDDFFHALASNINTIYEWFLIPLFNSSKFVFIFTFSSLIISILLLSLSLAGNLIFKVTNFLILTILILLGFVSSFIHIAILSQPVFASRVLISFTGFGLLTSYLIINSLQNKAHSYILISPFLFFSMVFSFSYSNASKSQERTDELLSTSIYYDVSHSERHFESVVIYGVMPSSRQRDLIISRMPIMNSLIPLYLNNNWAWGAMLLKHYGLNLKPDELTEKHKEIICEKKPFIKTSEYSLYDYGATLIISFDNKNCV